MELCNWKDMAANPTEYYMGAKPYTEKNLSKLPWSTGVLVQDKIDGVYLRVHKAITGTVKAFLRSGREVDINLLPGLRTDLQNLPDDNLPYFIEGDVVAYINKSFVKREETSGYINQITKSGTELAGVEFCLFCWFKGNKGDTAIAGYHEARGLYQAVKILPYIMTVPQKVSTRKNVLHIQAYAEDRVAYGKHEGNAPRDGIVCKDPDQKWEAGKPAGCVKVKPWQTMQMTVIGVTKHTKNRDMIGALMCCHTENAKHSIQVNIGSGMTNEDRLKDPMWYLGKRVLVEFEDITEPNKKGIRSLSLPRFKGVVA